MIQGKRRAVIVGINQYKDEAIPPLTGAENDARELYRKLQDLKTCNFEISENHFLIGPSATCQNIRKAISDVFWQSTKCDLALFYFSGHGFVDGYGSGYIAPFDIRKSEPLVCGIKMKELTDTVYAAIGKKSTVMVLDCCYSGLAAKGANKNEFDMQTDLEKYEIHETGEGRITLTSSTEDAVSREEMCKHKEQEEPHPHGIFTSFLIDGLEGAAAGQDESGIISVDKLRGYIDLQMENKGKQKPRYSVAKGSFTDNIVLALASEIYYNNISRLISEIETACNTERLDLKSLLKASSNMRRLVELGQNTSEITSQKELIDRCFENCSQPMRVWLLTYQDRLEEDLEKIEESLFMNMLLKLDNLKVEKIHEITPVEFGLLELLYSYARRQNDQVDSFKSNLRTKHKVLTMGNPITNELKQQTEILTKGPQL